VLIAAIFLIIGLAGCASSPQAAGSASAKAPAAAPSKAPAADESISAPADVTGTYVEIPELVDSNPQGVNMTNADIKVKYQGTANPPNLLSNPNFTSNGKSGGFTGNWAGGNWKETKFTADSPGDNPPAPKCLYLPQSDGVKDVMQRVPVDPGKWYYVSVWVYGEEAGAGTMITFAIYGNPGDGYGNNALARVNANTRFFITPGKWSQMSFIMQIPSVDDISSAKDPHLDIRFRQAPDTDSPARWFTKAEIYELDSNSVKPQ